MIRRYDFGRPIDTGAVVRQLPVRTGELPYFTVETEEAQMRFTCALVPYQGQWQQALLHRHAAVLNQPLPFVVETYHEGCLPGEMCGLRVSGSSSVRIGAVKEAEDGRGLVIRLAETAGEAAAIQLEFPPAGRSETISLGPFEIQTLYVPHDPAQPCRTMLLTELE